MFPTDKQAKADRISLAAEDYRAACHRQSEILQERQALLAMPLSTAEQVGIVKGKLDHCRHAFEAQIDAMLAAVNRADPQGDVDPGSFPWDRYGMASTFAINTAVSGLILAHVENRAREMGGDQSTMTLAQKHADLARIDVLIAEQETLREEALDKWRQATGDLHGYP